MQRYHHGNRSTTFSGTTRPKSSGTKGSKMKMSDLFFALWKVIIGCKIGIIRI
jgi:hypothetical protein